MLIKTSIIKRLPDGRYRLYSRKKDSKTNKRRNLGTFDSLSAAKKHEKDIQFFKHHVDDGCADDKITHIVSKMSDIAGFLEEAGFIDSSDRIYKSMCVLDGSLSDDEDYIVDMFVNTDEQMNVGGGEGFVSGSPGQGAPSFGVDQAIIAKLMNVANKLDKMGKYDCANVIDTIFLKMSEDRLKMKNVVNKLENIQKKKETEQVDKEDDDMKQKEDVVARSVGHVGVGVIDNPNCGVGQGLSDYYFYHSPGSTENNL